MGGEQRRLKLVPLVKRERNNIAADPCDLSKVRKQHIFQHGRRNVKCVSTPHHLSKNSCYFGCQWIHIITQISCNTNILYYSNTTLLAFFVDYEFILKYI